MKNYTITILLFTLFYNQAISQNWTGNVNSEWNNPANWSEWPLNDEDILIDPVNYSGAAVSPIISTASVFAPASLVVQNGALLSIQDNIYTSDNIEILGAGTKVFATGGILHAAGTGSNGRIIVGDEAELVINGGTILCNQRLIIESGAVAELNTGMVNAGEVLAIGDGLGEISSSFVMNNGTLITTDFELECETGAFNPSFKMNNGNLTVNGDLLWFGEFPGFGKPSFIINDGVATFNHQIINDPTGTVHMNFEANGKAQIHYNGEHIYLKSLTDSIKLNDSVLFTFSGIASVENNGVFHVQNASAVFSGITTLQGNGKYRFHHLSIDTGDTLRHVSPDSICVHGDFINNGFYNDTVNSIVMKGTIPQNIGGISITSFNGLVINCNMGVWLTNNVRVKSFLYMKQGILYTTTAMMPLMQLNAVSLGGSDSSYVNGPIRKIGNTGFMFPVGHKGKYMPIHIGPPASPISDFTASYHRTMYPDTIPYISPLVKIDTLEYWRLEKGLAVDSAFVKINWFNASESNIYDCKTLTFARWTGAAWVNVKSTNDGSCLGGGNGIVESSESQKLFGVFTFAKYDTLAVPGGIGVSETGLNLNEVKIYPVPLQRGSTLSVTNLSPESSSRIYIKEYNGKIVLTKEFESGFENILLNTNKLETGLYLLEIYQNNKRTVRKLVVE
ncbi:MAG TPA: T9SS type A sorting domain-containing protein [Flavobacteriales bacterium]|nr:T9SS type A sorting domain-containing protein [Flavobacteriales bacterium]